MTRKCSYCNNNGHNSRTCPNKGVKIFGVRLTDGSIRKSASMGSLSRHNSCNNLTALNLFAGSTPENGSHGGYVSEDFVGRSSSRRRERKKGVAWTEEEHSLFLLGLQKLGKGDWRGISKNYVVSRTSTQVASHAQKFYDRLTNVSRRKRRSSLFDMVTSNVGEKKTPKTPNPELKASVQVPPPPKFSEEVSESMDYTNTESNYYTLLYPTFIPCPLPIWPIYSSPQQNPQQVVRPAPINSNSTIKIDELMELSKMRIVESREEDELGLSLKLFDGSSRQTAFHTNSNHGKSNVGSSSAIHAV